MKHLGTLSGNGELFADEKSLGPVAYHLEVMTQGSLKEGMVSIEMKSLALVGKALRLQLADGKSVTVVFKQNIGDSKALFLTSGPIPGF